MLPVDFGRCWCESDFFFSVVWFSSNSSVSSSRQNFPLVRFVNTNQHKHRLCLVESDCGWGTSISIPNKFHPSCCDFALRNVCDPFVPIVGWKGLDGHLYVVPLNLNVIFSIFDNTCLFKMYDWWVFLKALILDFPHKQSPSYPDHPSTHPESVKRTKSFQHCFSSRKIFAFYWGFDSFLIHARPSGWARDTYKISNFEKALELSPDRVVHFIASKTRHQSYISDTCWMNDDSSSALCHRSSGQWARCATENEWKFWWIIDDCCTNANDGGCCGAKCSCAKLVVKKGYHFN